MLYRFNNDDNLRSRLAINNSCTSRPHSERRLKRLAEVAGSGGDAADDGALEEVPESVGGDAESSDFVGEPDAEGASAAWTIVAVAAEDAPSTEDFTLWTGLVESVQEAVANEGAVGVAVRTRSLLEPLGDRVPLLLAAVEPLQVAHPGASTKIVILPAWEKGGVVARYDVSIPERGAG